MSENTKPNAARRDEALHDLERSIKSRERKAKAAPLGVVAATVAVLALLVGGIYFANTYEPNKDNTADGSSTSATDTPEVEAMALPSKPTETYPASVTCEYKKSDQDAAKEVSTPDGSDVPTSGTTTVSLTLNEGTVDLKLDASKSPCTVNSFTHLVKKKFYNQTTCHRSVKSDSLTILQCGDPTASGTGGPGYTFKDEYPLNSVSEEEAQKPHLYPRGTLAMAKSGPDTNGSQFFLVTQDSQLTPEYNVFGSISDSGLKVLDKILDKAPEGDGAPAEKVTITKATVK